MKFALALLFAPLFLPSYFAVSQGPAKAARTAAASTALPPFSGSWVLDAQRSVLAQRISGRSTAVIAYDGKTWRYTHRHQASPDQQPEAWQISLTVDSPTFQVQRGDEITFRSRIQRRGRGLVLEQYGQTQRGQKIHNTTRYTLSDDGNTLTEQEVSVGPLGPQKSTYVLVRDNGAAEGGTSE